MAPQDEQQQGTPRPERWGTGVWLRPLVRSDEQAFLQAVERSRALHGDWVQPPATPVAFRTLVGRGEQPNFAPFCLERIEDGALVGGFNLSEIVRGAFQSTYLGYQAFVPHQGQGLMSEGLELLCELVFEDLELHRIEANVQPDNSASIHLVRGRGFSREGYSPRYLRIAGEWRDHERWALLKEDWLARRAP